jgi:carboxyl-terminal processing protease
VIGERTFGAGTIQTILPMGNASAIKLTTAKFYRPNGEGIEGNPVVPDLLLPAAEAAPPSGSTEDQALSKARALLGR